MLAHPRRTVFLFPGIFGEEKSFSDFREALSSRYDPHVVPYPGLTDPTRLLLDIDATAASMAMRLHAITPNQPVLIVGYSYGANLAFEVAKRLKAAGGRLALLVLLDPALPTTDFDIHRRGPAVDVLGAPLPRLGLVYESRFLRTALAMLCRFSSTRTRERFRRRTLWTLRAYARRAWKPSPIDCPVLHVMTEQFAPAVAEGWTKLCPDIRQVTIGSRHVDLLMGAALPLVVLAVSDALDRTERAYGPGLSGSSGRRSSIQAPPSRVAERADLGSAGLPNIRSR